MLEELVPLHCESVDESEYFKTTFFGHVCDCIKREPLSDQGSENGRLKRAPFFVC